MIMFGLVIAIAITGCTYFYLQDRKEAKRHNSDK